MKMKNEQMYQAVSTLSSVSEETGMLGYAIARNLHILSSCCREYVEIKNRKIQSYGQKEMVDGKELFAVPDDSREEFVKFISELAEIEHDVDVFTIPPETFFSGALTAAQMGNLWWMVGNDGKKKEEKDNGEIEI